MTQLNEQVALVTGATSGIGEAIALHLASLGVRLCAVGRNSEALEKVAQEAERLRSAVKTCQADLTNDEQVAEIVDNIKNEFGGLDILVHCAGVYAMGPLECASVQDLDDLYRANVRAPLLLTQRALTFNVEWFNPNSGETLPTGTITAGTSRTLTAPFGGAAVLYLAARKR